MAAARKSAPYVPHPIARAYYRYGLVLTRRDLGVITGMIQRNDGTKLDRINENKTTQWFLTYRDTPVRVLISQDFHKIVTFLPLKDELSEKQHKRLVESKRRRKKIYRNGVAVYVDYQGGL